MTNTQVQYVQIWSEGANYVEVNSIRLQSKTALKLWRRYITLGISVVFGKYYRVYQRLLLTETS